MDVVDQLRNLASEASIRSVPKLLLTAASEGIKATKKQAEEALQLRVPAQVLAPPPRSQAKVYSESPESRYACDLIDFSRKSGVASFGPSRQKIKPGRLLIRVCKNY